jgi:hypothetical protein
MVEKEYIDKRELLKRLCDDDPSHMEDYYYNAIAEASAADVVEVVRCKDCKNAYINSFSAQSGVALCRFWSKRSNGELLIFQQDDFCSYGERKEAADNG